MSSSSPSSHSLAPTGPPNASRNLSTVSLTSSLTPPAGVAASAPNETGIGGSAVGGWLTGILAAMRASSRREEAASAEMAAVSAAREAADGKIEGVVTVTGEEVEGAATDEEVGGTEKVKALEGGATERVTDL